MAVATTGSLNQGGDQAGPGHASAWRQLLIDIALLFDLGNFRIELLVVLAGADFQALFFTATEQA